MRQEQQDSEIRLTPAFWAKELLKLCAGIVVVCIVGLLILNFVFLGLTNIFHRQVPSPSASIATPSQAQHVVVRELSAQERAAHTPDLLSYVQETKFVTVETLPQMRAFYATEMSKQGWPLYSASATESELAMDFVWQSGCPEWHLVVSGQQTTVGPAAVVVQLSSGSCY